MKNIFIVVAVVIMITACGQTDTLYNSKPVQGTDLMEPVDMIPADSFSTMGNPADASGIYGEDLYVLETRQKECILHFIPLEKGVNEAWCFRKAGARGN